MTPAAVEPTRSRLSERDDDTDKVMGSPKAVKKQIICLLHLSYFTERARDRENELASFLIPFYVLRRPQSAALVDEKLLAVPASQADCIWTWSDHAFCSASQANLAVCLS